MSENEDTNTVEHVSTRNNNYAYDASMDIIDERDKKIKKHGLDLIHFIRSSNLDRTHTNNLLKLTNSISSNKNLPQTEKQL